MTSDHPRPDLRRESWWPLDGEWEFDFGPDGDSGDDFGSTIVVPFPHQSPASGIGDTTAHGTVRYRRRVDLPSADGGRLLLWFGAVDHEATVWLGLPGDDGDGDEVSSDQVIEVAHNIGGHVPFAADITAGAGRTCVITVETVDRTADDQPRGKQMAGSDEPFSEIRYTATTGIWQPVWIERVGCCHVSELHVRAHADGNFVIAAEVARLNDTGERLNIACRLDLAGRRVAEAAAPVPADGGPALATGRVTNPDLWSPDSPVLHDLVVELSNSAGEILDTVRSRVGFRTISTAGDQILLNGKPIVLRMALDQGYWPESLLALPSDDAARREIEWLREAGFNGVRKHMKIEDPRWWRWADELGLLVWQDMPAGAFHRAADPVLRERLADEWERAIRRDRSHPSAVCFSPFNESWGVVGVGDSPEIQRWVRKIVGLTRRLAPDALVVDNSGWLHVETDLFDVHLYDHDPAALRANLKEAIDSDWEVDRRLRFEAFGHWTAAADAEGMVEFDMSPSARGFSPRPYQGQPVVVSEMGGVGFVPPDPDSSDADPPTDRFVYSEAATADEFVEAIGSLTGVIEEMGLAGWCWTQVSDVEQEQNGLLTYDRRPKVSAGRIAATIRRDMHGVEQ